MRTEGVRGPTCVHLVEKYFNIICKYRYYYKAIRNWSHTGNFNCTIGTIALCQNVTNYVATVMLVYKAGTRQSSVISFKNSVKFPLVMIISEIFWVVDSTNVNYSMTLLEPLWTKE